MKHISIALAFVFVMILSCKHPSNPDLRERMKDRNLMQSDSIELTQLVRKAYAWRETEFRRNGFPFKLNKHGDSVFVGVDWRSYNRDMKVYYYSGFFADDFFKKHDAIALTIDSSIKQADAQWRRLNDGISIWDVEVDDWCGAQDFPEEYWSTMTLNHYIYSKDDVSFNWTWGTKDFMQPNSYKMKVKLENGRWKISDMEGLSYYETFDGYKKIMSRK